MIKTKYKMVRAGFLSIKKGAGTKYFYRIQALRDIPEHNVKTGDFGGYVTGKYILSQEGSCWIGGEAQVVGNVTVEDNAYIGDRALVHAVVPGFKVRYSTISIKDNVRITEDAVVISEMAKSDDSYDFEKLIQGNAQIYGHAYVDTVRRIEGDAKIYGNARVNRADWIDDASEIFDKAKVGEGCMVVMDSKIFDNAELQKGVTVHGSWVSGEAVILEGKSVTYGILDEGKLQVAKPYIESAYEEDEEDETYAESAPHAVQDASMDQTKREWDEYQGIVAEIESYRNDIVKIIKYPVMTDRTDPYTLKMMMARKKAQRLEGMPETPEFREAVIALEETFMMAESNAEKIASSMLSDEDKKKTEKAKDLFRIAANEASSDNEKKIAFVQGFKQLEGVIAVPEVAIDTFRVKVGLKELES